MDSKTITVYKNPLELMDFFMNEDDILNWNGDKAQDDRRGFEISINKWVAIRDNDVQKIYSIDTCGLCHQYFGSYPRCDGCPVFKKTGLTHCELTPCDDWAENSTSENAQREIDFLIELATEHGYTVVYEQ